MRKIIDDRTGREYAIGKPELDLAGDALRNCLAAYGGFDPGGEVAQRSWEIFWLIVDRPVSRWDDADLNQHEQAPASWAMVAAALSQKVDP